MQQTAAMLFVVINPYYREPLQDTNLIPCRSHVISNLQRYKKTINYELKICVSCLQTRNCPPDKVQQKRERHTPGPSEEGRSLNKVQQKRESDIPPAPLKRDGRKIKCNRRESDIPPAPLKRGGRKNGISTIKKIEKFVYLNIFVLFCNAKKCLAECFSATIKY